MERYEVKTAFDPAVHGFKFKNSFPPHAIAEFLNKNRGDFWARCNEMHLNKAAAILGFENFGLCGGMCWAALDRYYNGDQIPDDESPPSGDEALFEELLLRWIDTLRPNIGNGFQLLHTCLIWQQYPDENGGFPAFPGALPGSSEVSLIGRLTQDVQWPKIKTKIDGGIPATLCLIRAKWHQGPWKNHQVLATGYTYETQAKKLKIYLYDPNYPNKSPHLEMTIGGNDYRLDIDHSLSQKHIRGFFFWPYDRSERRVVIDETIDTYLEDLSWFWPLWN